MSKHNNQIGTFDYFAAAAIKGLLASGHYGESGQPQFLSDAVRHSRMVAKEMTELRSADLVKIREENAAKWAAEEEARETAMKVTAQQQLRESVADMETLLSETGMPDSVMRKVKSGLEFLKITLEDGEPPLAAVSCITTAPGGARCTNG